MYEYILSFKYIFKKKGLIFNGLNEKVMLLKTLIVFEIMNVLR